MGEDFISPQSIDELLDRTIVEVEKPRTIMGIGGPKDPRYETTQPPDVIKVPIVRRRDTKPIGKEGDTVEAKGNKYLKKRFLGAGGMGAVWHGKVFCEGDLKTTADDILMDVAIKEVNGLDPNSQYTHALRQEAQRMSKLSNDYIVKLLDLQYDEKTKTYYLIMEYIEGLDVDGLMKAHGLDKVMKTVRDADLFPDGTHGIPTTIHSQSILRIPDKIAAFVVWSVANALEYAHDPRFGSEHKRLIHRDISPGNILIKADEGAVKLADFGIAVNMEDLQGAGGIWSGKLAYTSPEAISGSRPMDTRSDLYSLGVVLYEMLTGFRPNDTFREGETLRERVSNLIAVYDLPLVPPHRLVKGIDRKISEITCKLLHNDPDRRYASASDLIDDIGFNYMFRGPGPTKQGLRDYLAVRKYEEPVPTELLKYLRFMRQNPLQKILGKINLGVWSDYRIHTPYEMTRYTAERLRNGENPARESPAKETLKAA